MFQPIIIAPNKDKVEKEQKDRKPREKSHILFPDSVLREIIDNKVENGIKNSWLLNKSIVSVIKAHDDPEWLFSKLKFLREYLIQYRKVRLFYTSHYQIIVEFKKSIRTIKIYKDDDLIIEGEVDMTE